MRRLLITTGLFSFLAGMQFQRHDYIGFALFASAALCSLLRC